MADRQNIAPASEFEEKVVQVSRVYKKTKGGNQFSFSILVVTGDKKGQVGVGLGKGKDVLSAIKKATKKARKNLINVPMNGATIPFSVLVKEGAAQVLLKPAPQGSGVIAGGAVRAVVEAAGIRDLSSKILGTGNQASNVYATFAALKKINKMVTIKGLKLKSISEVEAEEEKRIQALQEKEKEAQKEVAKKPAPAPKSVPKKPAPTKKPVAKKTDTALTSAKNEQKKSTSKKPAPKKVTQKA